MKLAFRPETLEQMKARLPAALEPLDMESAMLGITDPRSDRRWNFDFADGMRLMITCQPYRFLPGVSIVCSQHVPPGGEAYRESRRLGIDKGGEYLILLHGRHMAELLGENMKEIKVLLEFCPAPLFVVLKPGDLESMPEQYKACIKPME